MNKFSLSPCVAGVFCGLLFLSICGCEDSDTDNVDEYFDQNPYSSATRAAPVTTVTMTPSGTSLSSDGESVVLRAGGGTTPYSWSVHDVSRGSIVHIGGSTAVYQRDTSGDNIVISEDSQGNRGFATITQP